MWMKSNTIKCKTLVENFKISSLENFYYVSDRSFAGLADFGFEHCHTRIAICVVLTWQNNSISICFFAAKTLFVSFLFLRFPILGISSAFICQIGAQFKLWLIIQFPLITLHPFLRKSYPCPICTTKIFNIPYSIYMEKCRMHVTQVMVLWETYLVVGFPTNSYFVLFRYHKGKV